MLRVLVAGDDAEAFARALRDGGAEVVWAGSVPLEHLAAIAVQEDVDAIAVADPDRLRPFVDDVPVHGLDDPAAVLGG